MKRLLLFIFVIIISLLTIREVHANYTPGLDIAMTGSNMDVRFDVAAGLVGFDAIPPSLDTRTPVLPTFTGAFYASDVGWIMFSTGTYQVSLNCGGQSLDNLTTNCVLSGTGWSENIGDIYFDSGTTIIYDPNSGLISGFVTSLVGEIDLTGIALPLRSVDINESDIIAHHNSTLTISGAWKYNGGNTTWNMNIHPIGNPDTRNITGNDGIFTVDLSLAGEYEVIITDTNGSKTELTISVLPSVIRTSLEAGSHYAHTFCSSNASDSRCPDGATRRESHYIQIPPGGGTIANGNESYTMTISPRDGYGNQIENGTIDVKYITTVKNIQTTFGENIHYSPSNDGDAIIGDFANIFGSRERSYLLSNTDVSYTIASTAPTNSANGISLDSVIYKSGSTEIPISFTTTPLTFDPIYSGSIISSTPTMNVPHTFGTIIQKNDTTSSILPTPTIITTMKIGNGSNAEWRTLSSDPIAECTKYPTSSSDPLCDWDNVSSIATDSATDYSSTGTYTTLVANPSPETTYIKTYIYYTLFGTDILYNTWDSTIAPATILSNRVSILGQSGEGLGEKSQTRTHLINTLRKNIALMSRNRTIYTDVDYIIHTGDLSIDNASFDDKRTIVTFGGDITIDTNIMNRDSPLSIIALTDTNNNGGNITISGTVTDIHSSLIAEHAILSDVSDAQLYIHGSVISANPPREISPTTCPYFVTPSCIKSDYDLPAMRSGFSIVPATSGHMTSMSGSSYNTPLVIEPDPRLLSNPPPGMNK